MKNVYLTLIMSETRFKATLQIFLLILLGSSTAFSQASVISGSVTTSKTGYTVGIGNNRLIVVAVAHEAAAPARS